MTTTRGRIDGSFKGQKVTRPRTKEVDRSTPQGQLGVFLRDWADKHGTKALAEAMGVTERAVTKWCEGVSAPPLANLNLMAKTLGYSDWSKLAAAAVKFSKKS